MKATISDIIKMLYSDKEAKKIKGDRSIYGTVIQAYPNGKYEVQIDGADDTIMCDKLVGAEKDDTVLVTIQPSGHALALATVGGDRDALAAKEDIENLSQYFWSKDGTGSEAGAHVTEKPREEFEEDPAGGNLLMQSGGIQIRDGVAKLATFVGNRLDFYYNNIVHGSLEYSDDTGTYNTGSKIILKAQRPNNPDNYVSLMQEITPGGGQAQTLLDMSLHPQGATRTRCQVRLADDASSWSYSYTQGGEPKTGSVAIAKDGTITASGLIKDTPQTIDISDYITLNNGWSVVPDTTKIVRTGNTIQVYLTLRYNQAVEVRSEGNLTNLSVGIVKNAYKPMCLTPTNNYGVTQSGATGTHAGLIYGRIDVDGTLNVQRAERTGQVHNIPANAAYDFGATYIIDIPRG